MLSRTASSLYWVGRHIERADFTARLIDAALKFDMLPYADGVSGLKSAFEASGASYIYPSNGTEPTKQEILDFLAFDDNNPSSIYSCISKARHDVRTVRTAVTREVFEELNVAWLNFKTKKNEIVEDDIGPFVAWIEEVARGFDGALQRTLLRNESFWFLRLGAALERADNTARLLDVKYHVLLPKAEKVGGPIDQAQWTALLRSVSAETAYRWIYREGLNAWQVADMMILQEAMPRSLAACVLEANLMLARLRAIGGRTGPADRAARALSTKISGLTIDTIFQSGLHEFLGEFLAANNEVGLAVCEQFLF